MLFIQNQEEEETEKKLFIYILVADLLSVFDYFIIFFLPLRYCMFIFFVKLEIRFQLFCSSLATRSSQLASESSLKRVVIEYDCVCLKQIVDITAVQKRKTKEKIYIYIAFYPESYFYCVFGSFVFI